ncbi:hypothetical protein JP75_18320 [Devosia riboflavina]|uniref:Carnitine dehydratase n=1 Tax=Devosia riboflavina TaxID=46914 RepID=A0A087LZI4_9HYPH|nr:CoA transferase [Devosia riboflavina]KFL30037.1 hypothetical protein JP75_18320 [Devosia riboflavina]
MPEALKRSVFEGVRVLDVGHLIAGPMACSILGDFGAEVIKIERPGYGDPLRKMYKKGDVGLMYKVQGRNKKAVTINLKSDEGRALFHELVAISDVVVENFRPGVMERLGCGWDVLSAINPRLIMSRMSGYGQNGPLRDQRAYGRSGEAFGGFAHITGEADGAPMHSTMSLGDTVGAVWAAMGIMMALYWRDGQGGGKGQLIDIGLYEGLFRQIEQLIIVPDQLGKSVNRAGNVHRDVPFIGSFKTSDGKYFTYGASTVASTDDILRAMEMYGDPRFADYESSLRNIDALYAAASEWMGRHTFEEVQAAFIKFKAPGAPVMSGADLLAHAQIAAREMIVTVQDPDLGPVRMQNVVPKLSATPGEVRHAAQAMGASNDDVFSGLLGRSREQIDALRQSGAI